MHLCSTHGVLSRRAQTSALMSPVNQVEGRELGVRHLEPLRKQAMSVPTCNGIPSKLPTSY